MTNFGQNSFMNTRKAFSLIETLATMGILAIVVVFVLSGVKNDQSTSKFCKMKYDKIYNDIYTASRYILAVDRVGIMQFHTHETSRDLRNAFADRLDTVTYWDMGSGWKKNANGKPDALSVTGLRFKDEIYGIILGNGASIAFIPANLVGGPAALCRNVDNGWKEEDLIGAAAIDVNGKQARNEYDYDQFLIPIYAGGVMKNAPSKTGLFK